MTDEEIDQIRSALEGEWSTYEGDLPVTDACRALLGEVDRRARTLALAQAHGYRGGYGQALADIRREMEGAMCLAAGAPDAPRGLLQAYRHALAVIRDAQRGHKAGRR